MRRYNPYRSIYAGMPRWQLESQLAAMQTAYLELMSGARVVRASYTQGDGTKTVEYTAGDGANMVATIKQLQAQLGIDPVGRHPLRVLYY